jgi:hypothetical protein
MRRTTALLLSVALTLGLFVAVRHQPQAPPPTSQRPLDGIEAVPAELGAGFDDLKPAFVFARNEDVVSNFDKRAGETVEVVGRVHPGGGPNAFIVGCDIRSPWMFDLSSVVCHVPPERSRLLGEIRQNTLVRVRGRVMKPQDVCEGRHDMEDCALVPVTARSPPR